MILKTIQKIVLLSVYRSSSLFSMRGVVRSLLIQKVSSTKVLVNQKRSFRKSVSVRCLIISSMLLFQAVEHVMPMEEDMQSEQNCNQMFAKTYGENHAILFVVDDIRKDEMIPERHCHKGEHTTSIADNPFGSPSHDNNHVVLHSMSEIILLEKAKERVKSNYVILQTDASQMTQIIMQEVMRYSKVSLLEDAVASHKKVMDRYSALKKEHILMLNQYMDVACIVDPKRCGLEGLEGYYKKAWESGDYAMASIILNQKIQLDGMELALKKLDGIIRGFEQEIPMFVHRIENMSSATVEKEVVSSLEAEHDAIEQSIDEAKKELQIAKDSLNIVDDKLEIWRNKSRWTRFKNLFTEERCPDYLVNQTFSLSKKIEKLDKQLQVLAYKKNVCNQKLVCAQQVVEKQLEREAAIHAQEVEKQKREEEALEKQKMQDNLDDIEQYHPDASCNVIVLPRDLDFLQKQYQLPETYFRGVDSQIVEARELALQETVDQKYAQYEQRYEFNPQIAGYLLSQDLSLADYEYCFGTALQQHLHTEIYSIFNSLAVLAHHNPYQRDIIKQTLLFADAGMAANKAECIPLTTILADTSYGLLRFIVDENKESGRLIGLAAYQAIESMIKLPETTAHGIIALYDLLHAFKDHVFPDRDFDMEHFKSRVERPYQNFGQKVEFVMHVLEELSQATADWIINRPIKQKREDFVLFATDTAINIIVPEIVLCKVGKALTFLAGNLKNSSTLSFAKKILTYEAGLQPVVDAGAIASKDIKHLAEGKLAGELTQAYEHKVGKTKNAFSDFMDAETNLARKMPYKIWPWKKVLQKIKNYGNKIPLHEKELIQNLEHHLDRLFDIANEKINKKVMQKYRKVQRVLDSRTVTIVPDLDHIANLAYQIKQDNGFYKIWLEGGHFPGSMKELERAGLIVIKEEKMLRYGCRHYIAEDLLTGQKIVKTEFPSHWNLDKIMEKIFEAYDAIPDIRVGNDIKRIKEICKTSEGLEIQIILDIYDYNTIKLVTAFPILG